MIVSYLCKMSIFWIHVDEFESVVPVVNPAFLFPFYTPDGTSTSYALPDCGLTFGTHCEECSCNSPDVQCRGK